MSSPTRTSETREQRIDRKTAHYLNLSDNHGPERVIRFLCRVIVEMSDERNPADPRAK